MTMGGGVACKAVTEVLVTRVREVAADFGAKAAVGVGKERRKNNEGTNTGTTVKFKE